MGTCFHTGIALMSTSNTAIHAHDMLPLAQFIAAQGGPEPASFPPGAVAAAKATLRVLYPGGGGPLELVVQPEELLLVPAGEQAVQLATEGQAPPALTRAAAAAAASIACGSVLAGPTSESDEFGDVGFWLGVGVAHSLGRSPDGAQETLRALGLAARHGQQAEQVPLDADTALPVSLVRSPRTPQVLALAEMLAGLADTHAFRVRIDREQQLGAAGMLYVLLGRRGAAWMGLMGLGVWSDD